MLNFCFIIPLYAAKNFYLKKICTFNIVIYTTNVNFFWVYSFKSLELDNRYIS